VAAPDTLAAQYPGDRGIGSDRAVVFYDDFNEGSVAALGARYDDVRNSAGVTLVADHPAGSSSPSAVELTAGAGPPTAHLYKSLGTGVDELYLRYYAKYLGGGPWHHSGMWFGGYNPPLTYPFPRAGQRPSGNDWFWLALEPVGEGADAAMDTLDLYAAWMGMHSWRAEPTGNRDYFGNTLLHRADLKVESDAWVCYEIHLKLNPDPASAAGAVLEVWKNDRLVRHFDEHGPPGFYTRDKFCAQDADDMWCTKYRPPNPKLAPLEQRWRSTPALKINHLWMENFNDASARSSLRLAQLVAATRRVGCLAGGN
jgi:hypothetical protein